ncbi:hypothetical protein [Saccharothrix obliqua]|uniref:hypothetical protein n=1 Tax=Saccharothrix obliqua TaxID=2861747 RepID=UPI001C5D0A2B|nr:hypothetical protein [Saccharothrix obliqua]MBW4719338.1 hypothetical protein [Saccharothrix obliqua]
MAVRLGPVGWALILLVVGLAGVAAAVAFWVLGGSSAELRQVEATVVTPASCGGDGGYDRVRVDIDGRSRTAKLDGCGHRENEVVQVVLPADTSGEFTVRTADATSSTIPLETRVTATLLCLSGLAGGLYAYLFSRRGQPTASAEAV